MFRRTAMLIITVILFNFMIITPCFADSQVNFDNLEDQSEMLQMLLEEVEVLNEVVSIKREIIRNNRTLDYQNKQLRIILSEVSALSDLFKYKEMQLEQLQKIKANLEEIKEHTRILKMILSELQAMNEIVVGQVGDNIINCKIGEVFNLIFTGSNLKGSNEITYIITYNTSEVEVVDLCGITSLQDLNEGNIPDTNVEVLKFSNGVIKFTVRKDVLTDKMWSGVLNNIKFKSIKDGLIKINTKME